MTLTAIQTVKMIRIRRTKVDDESWSCNGGDDAKGRRMMGATEMTAGGRRGHDWSIHIIGISLNGQLH